MDVMRTACSCLGTVLPEKERIVVSLYYYADLNMKEIGEVLDITAHCFDTGFHDI
jgi:DNA-directed RNA polymerase specialized sigma24 family protein